MKGKKKETERREETSNTRAETEANKRKAEETESEIILGAARINRANVEKERGKERRKEGGREV